MSILRKTLYVSTDASDSIKTITCDYDRKTDDRKTGMDCGVL